jgi:hypothetical protein
VTEFPAMFEPANARVEERQLAFSSVKRSNSAADFSAFYALSPHGADSAKTFENAARETACRKTDEFPARAT